MSDMWKYSGVCFAVFLLFPLLTFAASCPNLTRNLSFGSRGTDVTQLQQFLTSQNLLAAGNLTGYFGRLTEAAVKKFQCVKNIVCSGSPSTTGYGAMGPKTRAAIARRCAVTATIESSRSYPPDMTPYSRPLIPADTYTPATCTPLGSQTQTIACPTGQIGSITQTRMSSCPGPTWGEWVTSANTCTVTTQSCTTPWGATVAHGASVTANQSASVPFGSQCVSEQRICLNGTLSGSYTNVACTVQSAPPSRRSANAVRINGTPYPIYRGSRTIGFMHSGRTVTAFDGNGATLWQEDLGAGNMFGGFDYDADGVADFALAKTAASSASCAGVGALQRSWVEVYSGTDGGFLFSTTPTDDVCFSQFGYGVTVWAAGSLTGGLMPGILELAPAYPTQGYFYTFSGRGQNPTSYAYIYPSTATYDATYPAASPSVSDPTKDYEQDSAAPNGLIVSYGGVRRFVFFTTRRVAQFAFGALNAQQLIADRPFVSRNDLAGRNYGIVSADPLNSAHVAVVAGTSAYSVWNDMKNGSVGFDQWGGIERHVTTYDLASNAVDQKFYSYAHDDNDGWKYKNRVVYPAQYWLPSSSGSSRIAYNVFGTDGHWHFNISSPGSTAVASSNPDIFVWDIRDVDGDGTMDVVASPSGTTFTTGYGYYFPDWATTVYAWDPATARLDPKYTVSGIPYLMPAFPDVTQHTDWLYPVLTGVENGKLGIYTTDQGGAISFSDLSR